MIIFWFISALMLVIALMFVMLPLWRGKLKISAVERKSANLEIFRDQIAEMDTDLKNGLLTQAMYEQGKRELQSRLLDEVGGSASGVTQAARNPLKVLALVLSAVLPLVVVGVYWKVGAPQAWQQADSGVSTDVFDPVRSAASLKALEQEVAAKPGDADSLLLLARVYSDLERFAEAAQAYDKLTGMQPKEAQLWADYADVLAMASGKTLLGRPTKLLDIALSLEPGNFKALVLAGSAAMERSDYAAAINHWEKLLGLIPAGDENAKMVAAGIQQARVLLAQKQGAKTPVKSTASATGVEARKQHGGSVAITGTVVLSEPLASRADANDTVFILVRAAEGPKMPLAILRKQVRDLPYKFQLDDSTAMTPQMKISNFDQVVVIARVSKSGNAMSQTGDLEGKSATIRPGTTGLELKIDQVLP